MDTNNNTEAQGAQRNHKGADTMNLINPINTVFDLVIHCKNAKVTPKACAEMIFDTIDGDTHPREILAECVLIARDLHNGYNQDYGRYGDKVTKQILDRI